MVSQGKEYTRLCIDYIIIIILVTLLDRTLTWFRGVSHWTPYTFIKALVDPNSPGNARQSFIAQLQADQELQNSLGIGFASYERIIREEVIQLAQHGSLGQQYDMDSIDRFFDLKKSEIMERNQSIAPTLVQLLRQVCKSLYSDEASTQRTALIDIRICAILNILCFTQQPKRCDFFPSLLGILMHQQGVKRSFFDLTNHFGLTSSYATVIRCLQGLSERVFRQLQDLGRTGPRFAIAYDNCELTVKVIHQGLDHQQQLYSITTGCILPGRQFPNTGLWQSMLKLKHQLDFTNIVLAPGNMQGSLQNHTIMKGFGFQAVQSIIPDISDEYDKQGLEYPTIPSLQRLDPSQQSVIALMPMDINESTNEAHFRIHDEIFKRQLRVPVENFETKPLYLVYGDNKTTTRIRAIKSIAVANIEIFNQLHHILPIPGFFHMLYNLGMRLNKIFYQTDTTPTFPCYLKWSQGKWARRHVAYGSKIVFT